MMYVSTASRSLSSCLCDLKRAQAPSSISKAVAERSKEHSWFDHKSIAPDRRISNFFFFAGPGWCLDSGGLLVWGLLTLWRWEFFWLLPDLGLKFCEHGVWLRLDKMVTACFQTSIDYGSFILALVQHIWRSQWTCPVDRTGTRSSHGWRRPANQGPMEVACRTVSQPRYQHPAECLMEQMLNKNRHKTSRESGNIKSKVTCILKIRKRAPH